MGLAGGGARHRAGVEHDLLAIGAVAAFRDHDRDHGVTDLEPVGNAASDLVDDPGRLHARNVGRRIGLLLLGPRAVAGPDVGRVHRRGMDADAHLAGAGVDLGQIDDLQNLGTAVSEESNCAHRLVPCPTTGPGPDHKVAGRPRQLTCERQLIAELRRVFRIEPV